MEVLSHRERANAEFVSITFLTEQISSKESTSWASVDNPSRHESCNRNLEMFIQSTG